MKLLRNTKGLTMVEVMVSFVILMLIIGITGGIMLSVFNNFGVNSRMSQAQMLGDNTYNFIANRLTYAVQLDLAGDSNGLPDELWVSGGRLYYLQDRGDALDVFGEDNYTSLQVSFSATAADSLLTLTVLVKDQDGQQLYQKSSALTMLNMERSPEARLFGGATVGEEPHISFSVTPQITP